MNKPYVHLDIDHLNLHLIHLNKIISQRSYNYVNDLVKYGLPNKITNPHVKRILLSLVIHDICEYANNCKSKNKVIFYYNSNSNDFGHLSEMFDVQELHSFYHKSIEKIMYNLPVKIYIGKSVFSDLQNEPITLDCIKQQLRKINDKDITFLKARNFLQRNKLTYLSDKYFSTLKSKQFLYK